MSVKSRVLFTTSLMHFLQGVIYVLPVTLYISEDLVFFETLTFQIIYFVHTYNFIKNVQIENVLRALHISYQEHCFTYKLLFVHTHIAN